MPKCSSCGSELYADSKFCPSCGAVVDKREFVIYSDDDDGDNDIDVTGFVSDVVTDNSAASAADTLLEHYSDEMDALGDSMSPMEKAQLLRSAAEAALEDLPEMIRLGDHEIPSSVSSDSVSAGAVAADITYRKTETDRRALKEEKIAKIAESKSEEIPEETPDAPVEKKKSSTKMVMVAAVAVVCIAAAGSWYFLGGGREFLAVQKLAVENTEAEAEPVEDITISDVIINETEPATEAITETVTYDSSGVAGTPAVTYEERDVYPKYSVTYEPEHSAAMGREISCKVDLSVGTSFEEDFYKTLCITAMYEIVGDFSGTSGVPKITMLMYIDDAEISVECTEHTEGESVTFSADSIISACVENGVSPEKIGQIAFRSDSIPVDVYKVTADVF